MQKSRFSVFVMLFVILMTHHSLFSQEVKNDVLYKIVSPSGLVIDNLNSAEDAGHIYLAKDNPKSKGQYWRFMTVRDRYAIYCPFNIKGMDVVEGQGDKFPVNLWGYSRGNRNQHWILKQLPDGSYSISHANSGMFLATSDGEKKGSMIYISSKDMGGWRLEATTMKLPPEGFIGKQ